jgi:hypothetical protein
MLLGGWNLDEANTRRPHKAADGARRQFGELRRIEPLLIVGIHLYTPWKPDMKPGGYGWSYASHDPRPRARLRGGTFVFPRFKGEGPPEPPRLPSGPPPSGEKPPSR